MNTRYKWHSWVPDNFMRLGNVFNKEQQVIVGDKWCHICDNGPVPQRYHKWFVNQIIVLVL